MSDLLLFLLSTYSDYVIIGLLFHTIFPYLATVSEGPECKRSCG